MKKTVAALTLALFALSAVPALAGDDEKKCPAAKGGKHSCCAAKGDKAAAKKDCDAEKGAAKPAASKDKPAAAPEKAEKPAGAKS